MRPTFQSCRPAANSCLYQKCGEPSGLAAPEDLLHELQRAELSVVDEVAAGALRDGRLELRRGRADQLFEVERDAGDILVGEAGVLSVPPVALYAASPV